MSGKYRILSSGLLRKMVSMVGLHAVNCVLPLIILPYTVRIVGLSGFGLISIAIAVNQYILLVSEYGFTMSVSRDVARCSDDTRRVRELFCNVQLVKLFLLTVCLGCVVILTFCVPIFITSRSLIYIGFGIPVGYLLTPTWLYLGQAQMDKLMVMTIVPRILVIPGVLLFVRSPADINIAMALQVLPIVLTGLCCTFYAYSKSWCKWLAQTWVS